MQVKPVNRFYVYTLCHPDGRPFYVGKGSGNRIANHESEAKYGTLDQAVAEAERRGRFIAKKAA